MNIKLLALDLDGTLLKSNNTLSDKVKRSIEIAVKNKIEVIIASGRPYGSMPDSVLAIESINYVIASNGASIYNKSGEKIYSKLLNKADVLKLLEITKPYDLIFEAFIDGLTYTDKRYVENPLKYGCSEAYIEYVKSAHGYIDDMRKFIYEHSSQLDSIDFVCTDKSLRESIRKAISSEINGFYITSSSEDFVEFMNKNASKSNAMKWLCNKLNIDIKHTSACGNADNDIDMIKLSEFGVAVKNASSDCLDTAKFIVPSNDDNGVAFLIEHILSVVNTLKA